ncbi:MAG TPA: CDP-alcohol phosphatidyltransferase family protein [Flavobacteriaceae bacterium]|nr:CDP-alcohol phosphatidyltransferase family protein [Flavobacteriaceae bacterium]
MIKNQIPNIITLLNLLSGSIAVIFAVQNQLIAAGLFVGLGIFFDFFDGLLARLLNAKSELGLQLDSLADMVTSGLVPGIVMFQLLRTTLAEPEFNNAEWTGTADLAIDFPWIAAIGLMITLASGYRLANFNIDERQTTSFIGLPTPANAILILSLPIILHFQPTAFATSLILNEWFLIGLTLFSCFILNANIPLFALKFKTWNFKDNFLRYGFLLLSVILLIFFQFLALPMIIICYLILSMLALLRN